MKKIKIVVTVCLMGLVLMTVSSCTRKINSTESLMKEIEKRYYGKWFKHVKFSQTADTYENDSLVKSEIWDEEYYFPTNLIIYITPGDTSNRYVYRNDSALIYENNILTSQEKVTHDAIILSMDIYNMTFPEIMNRLGDLKYDISKFHETNYTGRKVYVMGAEKGDTSSYQAWFDAEHLYLIKLIKPIEEDVREVELLNYIQLEKGWIEQEVLFKINGKVYMWEKYFNISAKDKDN
ncbi:MAG: hypothetical protein LBG80_06565 [Bacteroidales bacterium]|jgi:hypothetical protein|nr:hypothetical protein [Bacteroidales bacterium]